MKAIDHLALVNVLLEHNVRDIALETLQEGMLPPIRPRQCIVLGRDRTQNMVLVAGFGAMGVGLMWKPGPTSNSTPSFDGSYGDVRDLDGYEEALEVQYQ